MTHLLYPDLEVRSEDEALVLAARSPHNVEGSQQRSFQRSFVYTLSDASGAVLWRRAQGPREASPVAVFVHPSRRAVARIRGPMSDELLIFGPTGDASTLDLLSDPGIQRHAQHSTAGAHWDQHVLFRLAEIGGRLHFSILPWWGERVVVDLDAARVVRPAPDLDAEEGAFALRLLQAAVDAGEVPATVPPEDWDAVRTILGAALLCGHRRVAATAPLLRVLEQSPLSGRCASWSGFDALGLAEGDVAASHYHKDFVLRQIAQLSLRRLGLEPAALPATAFYRYRPLRSGEDPRALTLAILEGGDAHEDLYVPAARPASAELGPSPYRSGARAAAAVTPGMSAREVLDRLGAPDHVSHTSWEYDGAERTLRVTWGRGGGWFRRAAKTDTVQKVEDVAPPVWADPGARGGRFV